MSDLRYLQEGRLRRSNSARRRRRRRRIQLAACAVVVLAAAAFVFADRHALGLGGAGKSNGGSATAAAHVRRGTHAHSGTGTGDPRTTPVAAVDSGAPAGYAVDLAPVDVRRRVIADLKGTPVDKQRLTSGLLFDVRTGEVLWQRRATKVLPIASLTKMMTALLVATHSQPTDRVLITKQAVDFTGEGTGLLPRGKRVPELALLYALLLPSANDAAIALAQHVAGSQAHFIAMMNARAAAMGLTCTHYETVSGVINHDNHSCAQNLAVLAYSVLHNRLLAPIVASPDAVVKFPIKGGKLWLYNNNPLLRAGYQGTDGVKTGWTVAAGMCLVATVRRGDRWLGVVLLHSANWQTQAEALLNAGFAAS